MGDWPETPNEWALTWAVMICKDRIAELEELAAQYKWQRDELLDFIREHLFDYPSEQWKAGFIADLDRRWEER